jgi:hypothetical protein
VAQIAWPHLYRVSLADIRGDQHSEFTIMSELGGYKAVAIAMEVHCEDRDAWRVYVVEVKDLGLAPTNPGGTVGLGPPGTIDDRNEF